MNKNTNIKNSIFTVLSNNPAILLSDSRRGIEREALRITTNGHIAQTPHPKSLGSSLTNATITTDYSEAMIELITPPCTSVTECMQWLYDLHHFTAEQIHGDELLWNCSMPCIIDEDTSICPAHFGSSNEGRLKSLYRKGLKKRYGSMIQSIAGIHFNFSYPESLWEKLYETDPHLFSTSKTLESVKNEAHSLKDFKSQGYLHLIRNFLRHGWILTLLFGTTPAFCSTFITKINKDTENLQTLNSSTKYLPFATSIRSSKLGYYSPAQEDLFVSLNNLTDYCTDLRQATNTVWKAFSEKSDYTSALSQINDSILQIENEFYSPIRPKQSTSKHSRISTGLMEEGIQYLEVRCLDINPDEPVGISKEQFFFIEAFLLSCLTSQSDPILPEQSRLLKENYETVATNGRDSNARIYITNSKNSEKYALIKEQTSHLIEEIKSCAEFFCNNDKQTEYQEAISNAERALKDYSLLPSSKIIEEIKVSGLEFFHLGMKQTAKANKLIKKHKISEKQESYLKKTAQLSLTEQKDIESTEQTDFLEFIKEYTK